MKRFKNGELKALAVMLNDLCNIKIELSETDEGTIISIIGNEVFEGNFVKTCEWVKQKVDTTEPIGNLGGLN